MSDVNLTVQEGSDVYLSLTETPAVVSVSNPLIAAASFSVTVGTSVTVSNFPATQGISGTVTVRGNLIGSGMEETGSLLLAIDDLGFQNPVLANGNGHLLVSVQSGTVTASLSSANLNSVTVGVRGSVTIANFPATQVVSVSNFPSSSSVTIGGFSTSSLPPSTVTVANTVTVALDSASLIALENVTVTVGAAVTVAGFSTSSLPPSTVTVGNTVTISGTVTANVSSIFGETDQSQFAINFGDNFAQGVLNFGSLAVSQQGPISGTVTANLSSSNLNSVTIGIRGAVTVGNSVTIGSIPAISGTVTANVIGLNYSNGQAPAQLPIREDFDGTPFVMVGPSTTPEPFPISGTVTVSNVAGFNIPTHDFKSFAYTSGNLTQIAYKTGGASGTTVGILTLAYDGSGNLTSMTRT